MVLVLKSSSIVQRVVYLNTRYYIVRISRNNLQKLLYLYISINRYSTMIPSVACVSSEFTRQCRQSLEIIYDRIRNESRSLFGRASVQIGISTRFYIIPAAGCTVLLLLFFSVVKTVFPHVCVFVSRQCLIAVTIMLVYLPSRSAVEGPRTYTLSAFCREKNYKKKRKKQKQ